MKAQESSHLSPTNSKSFQSSPPYQQKLEFRAMHELLSDDRRTADANFTQVEAQSNEESLKENKQILEKAEEEELPSLIKQQQENIVQSENLSNECHSEDERNFEGGNQSEFLGNLRKKFL